MKPVKPETGRGRGKPVWQTDGIDFPSKRRLLMANNTHSMLVGYILWIFGFFGAHRFYFGRPVSGTLYFFTLGLLFIGWIIDLFLIPGMDQDADFRYAEGRIDYTIAWILLTFLGVFGIHRLYMGKWITAIIWFLTGGLFAIGYIYDFWTLNGQVSEINSGRA